MENTNGLLENALKIRYVRLKYTLVVAEDCYMPSSKTSAIRGGIGEMLLRANCISDRKCENCPWEDECIVQRMMYSRFVHKPAFVTSGESVGYIIRCDDYREHFTQGDTIEMEMILFGKTIIYFNQFLQALAALGQTGLGKAEARFFIQRIQNSYGEDILQDNSILMSRYKVETVADYVAFRKKTLGKTKSRAEIVFHTATTIKHRGKYLKEFDIEAIVKAVQRRMYILDSYEEIDEEDFYRYNFQLPVIEKQNVHPMNIKRFSNRKDQAMWMSGIKGSISISELSEEAWTLLIAGELIHVGKNTSFGFGQYRIMNQAFQM